MGLAAIPRLEYATGAIAPAASLPPHTQARKEHIHAPEHVVACEPCTAKTKPVGEQLTGGASGRTIRGCLAIRGYASAAGVTLIRQSSNSALHLGWRKYLPSPPPTEIQVREQIGCGSGFEPPRLPFSNRQTRKYPQSTPLTEC